MRAWLTFILAVGLAFWAGCQGGKNAPKTGRAASGSKSKSSVKMTPDNALRGRVAMVNANARSVILSFPIGWVPAVDRRLNIYRAGLKVGEVKITGPQIDTNIAADLIAGEAAMGDEAREN